jgi:phosphoribosylanthranilate isomerase
MVLRQMLTQIYEVSSAREAAALSEMGVDHIGVLVGDGSFPREQPVASAAAIAASIGRPAKFCALFLSSDMAFVARAIRELQPSIVHLGASPELVTPEHVLELKRTVPDMPIMRSVPVTGLESVEIARSYEGIADFLLLDSHRANDRQIGALGVTHDWSISREIVQGVRTPVILAGGLGPDNVADAIRAVGPAGVDSKTKTDKGATHTKDLEKVRLFVAAARHAAARC